MADLQENLKEYYKTEFYNFLPRGAFDYCTNISTQSSYIYFETAKVACSSIKKSLKDIEAKIAGIPPIQKNLTHHKNILLSPSSIGLNKFNEMLNDKSVIKFAFVRNPYTRVLSAYLDKITRLTKEKKRVAEKLNLDFETKITFNQFLRHLKQQPFREMDHHWRPQTNHLLWGLVNYNFIGRFENFEQDFEKILSQLYIGSMDNSNISIKEYRPHKTNSSSRLQEFYGNNENQRLVYEIYQKDFENFNYPIELTLD